MRVDIHRADVDSEVSHLPLFALYNQLSEKMWTTRVNVHVNFNHNLSGMLCVFSRFSDMWDLGDRQSSFEVAGMPSSLAAAIVSD
jgi:hypothetical protein